MVEIGRLLISHTYHLHDAPDFGEEHPSQLVDLHVDTHVVGYLASTRTVRVGRGTGPRRGGAPPLTDS